MTKFTKGILTVGLIVGLGLGGKYAYDYLEEKGYIDQIFHEDLKTNVEDTVVNEIEDFLNEDMNIGFVEVNYDELDISRLSFSTITSLLNFQYKIGDDNKIYKASFTETELYNKYNILYDTNIVNPKVCFNTVEIKEHLYSITNQYLDVASESNIEEGLCTTKVNNYLYMYDLKVNVVYNEDNKYTIKYSIKDINNAIYNQKYNYSNINIKAYNGTVILEKIDNKYIFISNTVSGGYDIYSI